MMDEWAYVTGLAKRTPGRSAGTRDENNDGKSVGDFANDANAFIKGRRALGLGNQLREEHALLTEDEVIAVRLCQYSHQRLPTMLVIIHRMQPLLRRFAARSSRAPLLTGAAKHEIA